MRVKTLLLGFTIAVCVTACSRADSDVQADLQKQLAADPSTANLTVTVTEGVAKITGVIRTKADQDRAMDIARAVKGVKAVDSAVRVDDAALVEEVKKAIASDETISAIPVRVEATAGEVKLFSDKTNGDQRARLVQVARGVYGVMHVEDNMK